MGAKTTMLVVAEGHAKALLAAKPALDRNATVQLLARWFGGQRFSELNDGALWDTYPAQDEVYAGHFGKVIVLAAPEFGLDRPSELAPRFIELAGGRELTLHTMHSVVDFFGYARWSGGRLLRALSLAPDDGILEEIGDRPAFELPYWAGEHPVDDPEDLADPEYEPYPFPFHPLELGEEVLRQCFGYQIEGYVDDSLLDASEVRLIRFKLV
jgi:hypothetical protein